MNPSASACERVDQCPASHVITPRVAETGEQADRGTCCHEFARRVSKDPSQFEAALSSVPVDWQMTCLKLDFKTALDELTVVVTESAYAVDAATGSIVYLGENIEREYNEACRRLYGRDLTDTEFCVSLDVEAMHSKGYPCAADWKTGIKRTACKDMWQMLLQAYVLAVKYDAFEVEARVMYVAENGNVTIDDHIFSRMELDGVPARLMNILNRIAAAKAVIDAGGSPDVHMGSWCTYCPAIRGCYAQTALVKAMLPDLQAIDVDGLTLPQAGAAWAKLKQIGALYEKIEKALKLRIYQEGEIPADEGYVYRVIDSSRMGVSNDKVRGMLHVLGATDEQKESIMTKTTFQKIVRSKA